MTSIIGFLESIEKLAYKILLWLILIPKTIVHITLNAGWAPEYIAGELKQEKSPFDEYISPIVLLLIVAFIPAVAFNFLPVFGTTISSPAEKEATIDRSLMFNSETNFNSSSTNLLYTSSWFVEKITGADENDNTTYTEIFRENHNSNEWYLEYINNNTIKDAFYYEFTPGEYYVNVYVEKVDTYKGNLPVEAHYSYLLVFVPENPKEQISISNYSPNLKGKQGDKKGLESITDQLKKETSILLALGLLIPPLLFALATKLFTSEAITENALRESFYAQCYYFSPISLAFWASYYADYFFTLDIFSYKTYDSVISILYLPLILAFIWFIGIETQAIARERQTRHRIAFLIVSICITVLGIFIVLATSFTDLKDKFRVVAIWLYPVASGGLVLAFALGWYKRLKAENRKMRLGELLLAIGLLIIIVISAISYIYGEKVSPSAPPILGTPIANISTPHNVFSPLDPTATEPPAPAISTLVATNTPAVLSSFYTEEFEGEPVSWTSFMTTGDESQVNMSVENGKLVFRLSPSGDSIPTTYLYNANFTYTDVQVNMTTTNNGNNSNAVILVCRLAESGWYEFDISNSGSYSIYAVDMTGAVQQGYNELSAGNSSSIRAGLSTNLYTAVCKGNELSLYINGDLANTVTDSSFNFSAGNIGIGISSLQGLPVDVAIDTLKVSQP